MNILICCSKHFYHEIKDVKNYLEQKGHKIQLPNSYDQPLKEEEMKKLSKEEHVKWKASMLRKHHDNVANNDAILVLNFEKNGQENYIGGATFFEIGKAFELNKKIFVYNPIPKNIFEDELIGMNPIVINGDLSKVA